MGFSHEQVKQWAKEAGCSEHIEKQMMGFEDDKRICKKFGNVHTCYDGRTYPCRLEARFAHLLDVWLQMGVIESWDYEPEKWFLENPKSQKRPLIEYVPDFRVVFPDKTVWYECKGYTQGLDVKKWELACDQKDIELIVVYAARHTMSVHKRRRAERWVTIWENVNKEFHKYKIKD